MPNSTLNSATIFIPDGTTITGSIVGGTLTLTGDAILAPHTVNQIQETVIFQPGNVTVIMQTIQNIIWTAWHQNHSSSTCGNCDYTITSINSALTWTNWNCSHEEAQARLRQNAERTEAHRREEATRREAWVAAEGEKAKARERASKLLQENLSPKQREELASKGHFSLEVFSKDGTRRTYQIHKGRSGNVKQVNDSGRVVKSLCCHPIEQVPDEDTMLAQKLFLEAREEDFLRIANHTNYG